MGDRDNKGYMGNRGMTKSEFLVVLAILLAIGLAASLNFRSASLKARDVQRKNDLRHIRAALSDYFRDVGKYPEASDGKILACGSLEYPSECNWGKDAIPNRKQGEAAYINPLPEDPVRGHGYDYLYFSNTLHFQLLAHLERRQDEEYNKNVYTRGVMCGLKVCNFGVGSTDDVRLDIELPPVSKDREATNDSK